MEAKSSSENPPKHLNFSVESILNSKFQKRKAVQELQLKSPKEAKLNGKKTEIST